MSAIDIVARGLAVSAANRPGAAAPRRAPLFTALGQHPAGGDDVIATRGHAVDGRGAGSYICDALASDAFAAEHPLAARRCQDGRVFRLAAANGAIHVEQFGAVGDGVANDQPAIQAAFDYAAACGIGTVLFASKSYRVHGVRRTSYGSATYARDGHPLVVTSNLELRSAIGDSELLFTGRDGLPGETTWDVIAFDAGSTAPDMIWRGGGILVLGDHGQTLPATATIRRFAMSHIHLRGDRQRTGKSTITYGGTVPEDGDGWDISDKGLWCQDVVVDEIILDGCEISGFKGELFYIGGHGPNHMRLENCVLSGSNGDGFNPGGFGRWEFIGGAIRNCYQAVEGLGGTMGSRMANTLIDDCDICFFTGGPDRFDGIHTYAYGSRDETRPPPWTVLDDVTIRNVPCISVRSWVRGRLWLTDSAIVLDGAQSDIGQLRDVKLDVHYVADQADMQTVVSLFGPATLSEQVVGGPEGEYIQPPANIDITIDCGRTELASRTGKRANKAFEWGGFIDARSSRIRIGRHIAANMAECVNKPPRSFPLIEANPMFSGTDFNGRPYGGYNDGLIDGDKLITPPAPSVCYYSTAPGTYTFYVATTLGEDRHSFQEGQRLRISHCGGTGIFYRFPVAGTGLKLGRERVLRNSGDYLDLVFSTQFNRWLEVGFFSSTLDRLTGSLAVAETSLPPSSIVTIGVPVDGATPGDVVSGVSLATGGDGLMLSGAVSGTGAVTITLYNPGSTAIVVPATTVRAVVVPATL